MENILTNLFTVFLAITCFYFAAYMSYYFSVVNGLDDLKEIRDKKIKCLLKDLINDKSKLGIDFFKVIDILNKDNKVWLLDTKKGNRILRISLWIFAVFSFLSILYFLLRSNILSDNIKNSIIIFDIIAIILYVSTLTWTIFHFYWDYVYNIAFHKENKKLKNFEDKQKVFISITEN